MELIFVPMVLFMIFVAPVWVVMHYRSKNRSVQGLEDGDRLAIDDMLKTVDRLTDRIETLERILDADRPEWRQTKYDE